MNLLAASIRPRGHVPCSFVTIVVFLAEWSRALPRSIKRLVLPGYFPISPFEAWLPIRPGSVTRRNLLEVVDAQLADLYAQN